MNAHPVLHTAMVKEAANHKMLYKVEYTWLCTLNETSKAGAGVVYVHHLVDGQKLIDYWNRPQASQRKWAYALIQVTNTYSGKIEWQIH